MKLLALLAILLGLLSATAAEAHHHHHSHAAIPLPKPRPDMAIRFLPQEPPHNVVAEAFAVFGWR
jgi:hypothetical protein